MVALAREFRTDGIEYAVCGGMAIAVHGFIRATEDIDILVEAESLPRLRKAARRCGFHVLGADHEFKSGARLIRLVKVVPGSEDYLILDVLLASGPNAEAWASRRDHATPWGTICVVSREALIAMKQQSGRAMDLEDIERLNGSDEAG